MNDTQDQDLRPQLLNIVPQCDIRIRLKWLRDYCATLPSEVAKFEMALARESSRAARGHDPDRARRLIVEAGRIVIVANGGRLAA
jgi:hypothetical protein